MNKTVSAPSPNRHDRMFSRDGSVKKSDSHKGDKEKTLLRARLWWCSSEFLVALSLEIALFSSIFYYAGYGSGYTTLLYAIVLILFLAMFISDAKRMMQGIYYLVPLALLIVYLLTLFLSNEKSTLEPIQFITFSLFPFLLFYRRFDVSKLLKYLVRVSLLVLPFYQWVFAVGSAGAMQISLSYGLIPSIMASIALLRYFRSTLRWIDYIALAVNCLYMLNLIIKGNRGQLVALAVLAVLLYIGKFNKQERMILSARSIRIVVVGVVVIVGLLNLDLLINVFNSVLQGFGLDSYSLTRSTVLADRGIGADTFRFEQYAAAWKEFLTSPIIGHGFSTFSYINSGGFLVTYPHNLFFQALHDGGILLFLVMTIPLVAGTFSIFRYATMSEYALFVLLFANAIPHFMLSSDIFLQPDLWLLLGYLNYYHVRRKPVASEKGLLEV